MRKVTGGEGREDMEERREGEEKGKEGKKKSRILAPTVIYKSRRSCLE